MASKKFSEFSAAGFWRDQWYLVGYDPGAPAETSNKRIEYVTFTNTFALKATFDAHAADQTLHLSAAQNAGLDASSSPSAVNPYLTESAGDARYPDATAQAAKDSGQDAAIAQNETDLTTHKSSGDHDARYLQDAPSDGTPYARQDAGWITIPDDGLPAGGTTGQHLAKTSNTSYDAAWVDPESGGGGLTHQVVPITSSNLNAANGNLYLADVSELGAGIEFILPAAVAGGSIGLILTTDAPATYGNALVIRANGSIAAYLLAKGEEMNFTSDGVSWLFNTTGLLGVKAEISLENLGAPQFSPNAWIKIPFDTVVEDSYGYVDIANHKFVPRRPSTLFVYARAGVKLSPSGGSVTLSVSDAITSSIIEVGKQYNDGASTRNLSPSGTVPYIGERGEDLFVNLYNASAGSLDPVIGSNIKLTIQEIW